MGTDVLKRISESIIENYLGFSPASNSTKPPHVANGLFRYCTGETCDSRDVHEWITCEGSKNAIPSGDIIDKYQDILQNGYNEKVHNIKELRLLLNDVFDQDNALFPNYEFSAVTISSHWLIKKQIAAEGEIGEFLFKILEKKIDGKRSPIIEMLQKALNDDDDDITKLIKPIIAFPSEKEKRRIAGVSYHEDIEISWDEMKQKIRNGFDRLADNLERIGENKNSLLVLRRIVNFSVFATFLYLTHCNYAVYNGINPPIVLDAGGELLSIKKASEQCLVLAKKSVEEYYVNCIKECVSSEIPEDSIEQCLEWIDAMVFSTTERQETIVPAIKSYFESFSKEEESAICALARALQIVIYTFDYKHNSPSDFCRVLGVRTGLIGPKGNRAKVKRYLINSFTLETITYSVLTADELLEGIEMKELSEKLINSYNILIGADAEQEYSILENCNITQATPGDLRGELSMNAQILANTYISLGLGRKYADGVTLIGWRL